MKKRFLAKLELFTARKTTFAQRVKVAAWLSGIMAEYLIRGESFGDFFKAKAFTHHSVEPTNRQRYEQLARKRMVRTVAQISTPPVKIDKRFYICAYCGKPCVGVPTGKGPMSKCCNATTRLRY